MRPDVSEKKSKRKILIEKVHKASLGRYISPNLIPGIESRVLACSERIGIASRAWNAIVKESFAHVSDDDIITIPLSHYFDQTFVRQLLLGTKSATKPNDVIKSLHAQWPMFARVKDLPRFLADSNMYCFAATQMVTNLRNHMSVQFIQRQTNWIRCIREQEEWPIGLSYLFQCMVNQWPMDNENTLFPQPLRFYEMVSTHRRLLGFTEEKQGITNSWIKSHANVESKIHYMIHDLRYREAKGYKLYNIAPINRTGRHFITLDTTCLHGLMKEANLVQCTYTEFDKLRWEQWESVLKYKSLEGKNQRFTGTISTDGVSISIHYNEPKQEAIVPKNVSLDGKRVIAVDPGRTNIFYAVEKKDDQYSEYKFTRRQYYQESGIFRARSQTEKWHQPVQEALDRLSENSPKGMDWIVFQKYLHTWDETFKLLWEEYKKRRWARQRLTLYSGKQQSMDNYFNQWREGGDPNIPIIVGYGASRFACGGKGEMNVPVKSAYQACARRFETQLVNEYGTSQVHTECKGVCCQVKDVRGLRWCNSTSCCKFINRDLNAAIQIYRCFTFPVRPPELCNRRGGYPKQTVLLNRKAHPPNRLGVR